MKKMIPTGQPDTKDESMQPKEYGLMDLGDSALFHLNIYITVLHHLLKFLDPKTLAILSTTNKKVKTI